MTLREIDAKIRELYEKRRPLLRQARLEGLSDMEFIELRSIEDELDRLEELECQMQGTLC